MENQIISQTCCCHMSPSTCPSHGVITSEEMGNMIVRGVANVRNRETAIELLISYVQELVEMWPNISLRTLSKATEKVADLKEALALLKSR